MWIERENKIDIACMHATVRAVAEFRGEVQFGLGYMESSHIIGRWCPAVRYDEARRPIWIVVQDGQVIDRLSRSQSRYSLEKLLLKYKSKPAWPPEPGAGDDTGAVDCHFNISYYGLPVKTTRAAFEKMLHALSPAVWYYDRPPITYEFERSAYLSVDPANSELRVKGRMRGEDWKRWKETFISDASAAVGFPVRCLEDSPPGKAKKVDMLFNLTDDVMDKDGWAKLGRVYEVLPGYIQGENGFPYWFGTSRTGNTDEMYLSISVEPPGLQVSGQLAEEDWQRWESRFIELASEALGFQVRGISLDVDHVIRFD